MQLIISLRKIQSTTIRIDERSDEQHLQLTIKVRFSLIRLKDNLSFREKRLCMYTFNFQKMGIY